MFAAAVGRTNIDESAPNGIYSRVSKVACSNRRLRPVLTWPQRTFCTLDSMRCVVI